MSVNENVDATDVAKICKTEYRNFTTKNMSQDILNPEAIADLRLGGVYDYIELGKGVFNNGKYQNRNAMYFKITDNPKSTKIQRPKDISLLNGLNEIKNISFTDPPQGFGQYLETKLVNSLEVLNITCGLSYTGFGFNASATLGYNAQVKKNKFIVTYLNPVYTVTALPDETGKLFNNDADNNNGNYVYIDKITYGVRLLVYFETELSEEDTKLAFSASGYGAKGNWNSDKKNMVENTTYKLYLFGRNEPLKIGTNLENIQIDINTLLAKVVVGNEVAEKLIKHYCFSFTNKISQDNKFTFVNEYNEKWYVYKSKLEGILSLRAPKADGGSIIIKMKGTIEGNLTSYKAVANPKACIAKELKEKEMYDKTICFPLVEIIPITVPFSTVANDVAGFGFGVLMIATPACFNIQVDAEYDQQKKEIKLFINKANAVDFTPAVKFRLLFMYIAMLPMTQYQDYPVEKAAITFFANFKEKNIFPVVDKGKDSKTFSGNVKRMVKDTGFEIDLNVTIDPEN